MRAAIYARYSSDLQSETSIDDQVRLCREYAERNNMDVSAVFTDYAISGGNLNNRPGMLSLMQAAKVNDFDVVIAEALDRISRDQEDIAAIYKRLTHADVRITTVSEGDVNELHIGLKGTMNALFLKDLAIKTRRGQRGRVEAGKIPGGNSFGYKIVRRILDDGSVSTGEREINPDQAAIIKRIFTEYADGMAPRRIASALNAEGITSPRGGQWNASTINGSRQRKNGILNNELYLGRIIYNRQRFVKDPETGKRVSRLNPEHDWIITDVPALRIIDNKTWDKVQKIKSRYSSQCGSKRQTKKRLLTGLVKCGCCGGSMTIINRERYYCSAKREKGTCDSSVGIKAVEIEERVLGGLKDILLGNEELIDTFVGEFKAEIARLRKQRSTHERQSQKDLNKINTAIKRCLKYVTEGDGDPGLVRDELRALEQQKKDLDHVIKSTHNETAIEVHPNIAELYRKKVLELQTLLADETSRPQAMEIIRSMIDHIEVHAGEERGEAEVILVGALAQILTFTQQKKTVASNGSDGRVLMVAGAGFEPATFRL
ncbi:MAG: recombinase family protein [Alphaproteobacteria bacterium]|nr:recombinase family protein [Alphaproteobacteria bacterium]MBT4546048.1 recombinase family protein [Alphaproteobacteria bacterium]MBT7746297.1 recombinase family protein [Alphaproteobacteria bacterium]